MAFRSALATVLVLAGAGPSCAQEATPLPCQFEHGLITLLVPQPCQDTLRFYLDTGGIDALYRSGQRKRCSPPSSERDQPNTIASCFRANGIPWPTGLELQRSRERDPGWDGMLGRGWFGTGRWRFDLGAKKLAAVTNDPMPNAETVTLGKRPSAVAGSAGSLLRIPVLISGDTVHLLFDTGARMIDDRGVPHATSFISDSLFNRWHARFPEWTVLPAMDHSLRRSADQIIVPELTIGTRTIGPVVFTLREKQNFEVLSRHFMDRPVVGALGANALVQLGAFIVDYPTAEMRMATQEKP